MSNKKNPLLPSACALAVTLLSTSVIAAPLSLPTVSDIQIKISNSVGSTCRVAAMFKGFNMEVNGTRTSALSEEVRIPINDSCDTSSTASQRGKKLRGLMEKWMKNGFIIFIPQSQGGAKATVSPDQIVG